MNRCISGFLLCLLFLIFAGCSVLDDDPAGTWMRFVNNNTLPVNIYSDSARQIKIAEVPAGKQSELIAASPNSTGAAFYPTYQIEIETISILYDGDVFFWRIDENKTTTITVPSLKDAANPNTQLTTDVYLIIQNKGTDSLILQKGNSEIPLEGVDSAILNDNETGTYIINPGPVLDYSLRINTDTPVGFPGNLTEFVPARLYSFVFNGTLTLQKEYKLTLAEVLKTTNNNGSETNTFSLTENTWTDGSITSSNNEVWYSINVTSKTKYYIWWNDSLEGNGTKTSDIRVSAYYGNGGASIFMDVNSSWTNPQSFTANSTGIVKMKVTSSVIGTYAIAYSTSGTKPQVPVTYKVEFNANGGNGMEVYEVSANSIITLPNGTRFSKTGFSFDGWTTDPYGTGSNYNAGSSYTVTGDVIFYARWKIIINQGNTIQLTANTWADGKNTKSSDTQFFKFSATAVTQYIHVRFGTLSNLFFQVYDSNGYRVAGSTKYGSTGFYYYLSLNVDQVYYIYVSTDDSKPDRSSYIGTYQIAFNASSTPPPITLPSGVITLTVDNWANGSISLLNGTQWFKFTKNTNTKYVYIHVNFGTLNDLYVRVYDSSGYDDGFRTNLSGSTKYIRKELTSGQEYYINVESSFTGTYKIAFSPSETPPP